ncbi:hypothetical protein L1887_39148 [Cichorium endivia]|nr:hypothetical protein L1887_39148 [Cichorium endivia]
MKKIEARKTQSEKEEPAKRERREKDDELSISEKGEFGTSFHETMDMIPLSLYDDGHLHDIGTFREATVIDDDHVDSETVGTFCTMAQGEKYISKVKALEAGKVAKRREEEKEKERRMNKEAFRIEREKI